MTKTPLNKAKRRASSTFNRYPPPPPPPPPRLIREGVGEVKPNQRQKWNMRTNPGDLTKDKINASNDQPALVCGHCGELFGRKPCGMATWHEGTCGVCYAQDMVTEPRDFGYLRPDWNNRKYIGLRDEFIVEKGLWSEFIEWLRKGVEK